MTLITGSSFSAKPEAPSSACATSGIAALIAADRFMCILSCASRSHQYEGPNCKAWSAETCCIPETSCLPCSFGTGMQRPKFGKSGCPGPGAYRLKSDLGKQFDSSKHSSSNVVFTIATKACTEKVGIRPAMLVASHVGGRASVETCNLLCKLAHLLHRLFSCLTSQHMATTGCHSSIWECQLAVASRHAQ